jgi:hypothetical protein
MQQPFGEVELDKLADFCGSLDLHHEVGKLANSQLDYIASALGRKPLSFAISSW